MKTRIKTLALGALVAGSLIFSAGSAMAREYDHWSRHDYRGSDRRELRQDYAALDQWRAKLAYDASHHASRKKLAQDQAQIQALENEMRNDRGGFGWHW